MKLPLLTTPPQRRAVSGMARGAEEAQIAANFAAQQRERETDQICSKTCCNRREEATDFAQRAADWSRASSGRQVARTAGETAASNPLFVGLQGR
jgi:hypothetical protein